MTPSEYRSSASFGKRQEFVVIAELLRKNYDVYLTLVDDQGIDCIIRLDQDHYLDIQIKARSKKAKHWHFFPGMKIEPRDNYFFIFYTEVNDTFWVLPSTEVVKYARRIKTGDNAGKYSLTLPTSETSEKAQEFSRFKGESGFQLLRLENS